MKGIYVMTVILLIALALPFGTSFASAQEESVGTALPSVSAQEESDGIVFGFYGGGITREPATETMVQVAIAHMCEVNDELILKKVEIFGENGIPIKTFDVNETLESVADSYDQLKLLSEKLESTPDEEISSQAATLVQELRNKSFSTKYFTLDLNDLKQSLTLGDRVPIIAEATFIHNGEALVIERSLSVEYQPSLTSSPPEGKTTSSLLELQDWKPGVQHVHTEYSWYDWAYITPPWPTSPTVLQQAQAAKYAGLSWIIITDHEPMLAWPDPEAWNNEKIECQAAEEATGIKVMLGEELGNVAPYMWAGHYLGYNINSFVDSDRTNQGMIDAVKDQGGFGYIAHPYTSWWDEFGDWDDWNATGYTGLEIMNGPTACADAINKWTEILEDPSARIFGIGNSDAHFTEDVASAYTWCDIGEAVTHSSVYSALEDGHSVVTNGPLIAFTIDDKKIGDTVITAAQNVFLDIAWDAQQSGTGIQKIEVYSNAGLIKTIIDVSGIIAGSTSVMVNVSPQTLYIRLKGIVWNGDEAYTNPIWVNCEVPEVTAGRYHTVGLKADGTVVAVGDNYYGQCNVGGWTDITQVAPGYWHTAGLKSDGTVVAVGNNAYGKCDVGGWTDITQVAVGSSHTVGLKADGTVVAVGFNYNGQCDVGGWTDIVQVATNFHHTVGLKADGTVVAVGDNYWEQCDVGGWTNIIQVDAGSSHTVGLKSDGTVVAVGYNYYGQCNVGGWTDITQVAAGVYHTAGLKSDGTVVVVGSNYYGQCNVGGWTDITQVDTGVYHTVGLKSDGTVVAVGSKYYGQCDVGGWMLK